MTEHIQLCPDFLRLCARTHWNIPRIFHCKDFEPCYPWDLCSKKIATVFDNLPCQDAAVLPCYPHLFQVLQEYLTSNHLEASWSHLDPLYSLLAYGIFKLANLRWIHRSATSVSFSWHPIRWFAAQLLLMFAWSPLSPPKSRLNSTRSWGVYWTVEQKIARKSTWWSPSPWFGKSIPSSSSPVVWSTQVPGATRTWHIDVMQVVGTWLSFATLALFFKMLPGSMPT